MAGGGGGGILSSQPLNACVYIGVEKESGLQDGGGGAM